MKSVPLFGSFLMNQTIIMPRHSGKTEEDYK
jgi:hypothetical protein